jgi:hypothetical protein
MKYESIKKHGEKWVKIRPALQQYDNSAVLQYTVEDAWWLSEISENSMKLRSRDTKHEKLFGLDQIHHYMEDPESLRTIGTEGTLVMNVQLLLYEGKLLSEPIAPPGTPLTKFVPARPRADLFTAGAKAREETALSNRREVFAQSHDGFVAAIEAFKLIGETFLSLNNELIERGTSIEMQLLQDPFEIAVFANGWWVTFTWRRGGTLSQSELQVAKWDSNPPWRGRSQDYREPLSRKIYHYGLVSFTEARWILPSRPSHSWTSSGLATEYLTDLITKRGTGVPFTDVPMIGTS